MGFFRQEYWPGLPFPSPGDLLDPGMETAPLTFPAEDAICEEQGLYYLFVALDCEHFRKREVSIGESNGDMVQILNGLNSGDLVVTDGVHQLKAASRKSVIPEGHSHSH